MQTQNVIILCAVIFCAALVLGSVLNRPTIIIQEREKDRSGFGWLLFLGVGFLFLIFDRPGCEQPLKEAGNNALQEDKKQHNNEPLPEENYNQRSVINQPPRQNGLYKNVGDKYSEMGNHASNSSRLLLVIIIKRYTDCEKAENLTRHFSKWEMKIFEIAGECWDFVEVQSREEAKQKILEWKRHEEDFEGMELEFSVETIKVRN